MALTATGLGIGTSAPGYKLDVVGDINFTGNLRQNGVIFSGGGGSGNLAITGSVTVNNFAFNQTAGVNASLGNVLIGSNASGHGVIQTNGSQNSLLIGGITAGGTVQIWLNNLRVDCNVGFGVDPGTFRLNVSGNTNIDGVLTLKTNVSHTSVDGINRLYYGHNSITYFGSPAGYYFQTAAGVNTFIIDNAGSVTASGNILTPGVLTAQANMIIATGVTASQARAKLHIRGGVAVGQASGTINHIAFESESAGYNHYITTTHAASSSSLNAIHFWLNNTTQGATTTAGTGNVNTMSVTGVGVGINTASPLAKLDILGGAGSGGSDGSNLIAFQYRDSGYRHFITTRHNAAANVNTNAIDFWLNNSVPSGGSSTAGTGNLNNMSITAMGAIVRADVPYASVGSFANLFANAQLVVKQISADSCLYLANGNTNNAGSGSVIQSSSGGSSGGGTNLGINPFGGSVGIGTNSPGYTLDVAGRINASNDVNIGFTGAGFMRLTTAGGATYIQSSTTPLTGTGAATGNFAPIYFTGMAGAYRALALGSSGLYFLAAASTTDTVNGAPSYGIGMLTSGVNGLGGYLTAEKPALQIANYWGINFVGGQENWGAGASHMAIVNGRVGIQNTNPQYTLDVNGTTRLSGEVTLPTATAIKTGDGKRRLFFFNNGATYIGTGNNEFHVQNSTENINYFTVNADTGRTALSGTCCASKDAAGNFSSRGNFTTFFSGTGGGGIAEDSYELWWYPLQGQGFNKTTGTHNLVLRMQAGSSTALGRASFQIPIVCSFINSYWYNSADDATNRIHFELSGDTYFNVFSGKKYVFQVGGYNVAYLTSGGTFTNSDRRIKKNIVPSPDALPIINALNFCSFNYIDTLPQSDTHIQHGLIAQEVFEVYPEAVSYSDGFIPTAFSLATQILKVDSNLHITTSVPHQFIQSDTIELIIDNNRKQLPIVSIISDTEFTVAAWDNYDSSKDVFVFGKKTNDYMNIDKAQFGMLAARACQTLSKQITSLQAQVASQQSTINAILAKLNI